MTRVTLWLCAALVAAAASGGVRAQTSAARAAPPTSQLPPGARQGDGGPSPAIFPPGTPRLRFDHRLHCQGLGVECVRCHPGAATSRRSSDRLLPTAAVCDDCHGPVHPAAGSPPSGPAAPACSLCHLPADAAEQGAAILPSELPTPRLRFDHAVHFARNIGCGQCHGAIGALSAITREHQPRMRGCLTCHQLPGPARGAARGECRVCHLPSATGRIDARLDTGPLLPPAWMRGADHGPGWIERHIAVAAADSAFCANCHSESECVACHDGRVRPRKVHPGDWLSMHALAAKQASSHCSSCHRQQSFCATCHRRSGVTLSGPSATRATSGRFHPPKTIWTDAGGASSGHHGAAARQRLDTCTSCHTERDCLLCHAAASRGGPAGLTGGSSTRSPHPPGFAADCRRALNANPRACLSCHAAGDLSLTRCR